VVGIAVRIELDGPLAEHVAANTGEGGLYRDAEEYLRDLVRRDLGRMAGTRETALKAELQAAFAEPDEAYEAWDVDAFLATTRSERV
jgi:Arc/MetJ-type ribon-helix-helix transcriptional regulator